MSYYLASSLVQLRDEINAKWPGRDKTSDGWIGDTSHQARPSDHNPDWDSGGVVRAIDVDKDGINVRDLLNEVIGDERVWYVIFNRKIYSMTYGWHARAYTGSNPHEHHVHISIRHTRDAETSTKRWFGRKRRTTLPVVDLSNVRREFHNGGENELRGVRLVQRALNVKANADLVVDGFAGRTTRRAYRYWENKIDAPDADGIPGKYSLERLGKRRFRVRT